MSSSNTDLAGKVAFITGASRRSGRETAVGLAKMGADIVVHASRPAEEINQTAALAREAGARVVVVTGDVADEHEVRRFVAEARDAFGRLDILINNAAIRRQVPFLEMSLEEWRDIFSVNLDGTFLCAREALPALIESGDGVIINLGGISAHLGAKNRAHVSAAKAGVVGLTRALAIEFADQGVRVNCVVPGKIGGPRAASAGEMPAMGGGGGIPMGREGEVEECAALICALCGPAGRFMTGQTVHVNGGHYLP